MPETIICKFFIAHDADHEHFRIGEIIGMVGQSHVFVRFERVNKDMPLDPPCEIISLEEMANSCQDCGMRLWQIFDNREDIDTYTTWLEAASSEEPKIHVLKKDDKKH